MSKFKNTISLLCVLVIIISIAFLPKVVALALDNGGAKSGYYPLQSVQLEQDHTERLTLTQKLYLVHKCEVVVASPNDTLMDEEAVRASVDTVLAPYFEYDLLRGWLPGEHTVACYPTLGIDYSTGYYSYSWAVHLRSTTAGNENAALNLTIDDETGKLLSIYFWQAENVFRRAELTRCLDLTFQLISDDLNLEPPCSNVYAESTKIGCSVRYEWLLDYGSGTLNFFVEFYMFPQGFYSMMPF